MTRRRHDSDAMSRDRDREGTVGTPSRRTWPSPSAGDPDRWRGGHPPHAGLRRATKEITRRFAAHGYLAICPNLYSREAPGASPDDAAAAARANGGVPDERLVGRRGRRGRLHPVATRSSNGKVATIGYCSGGRQSFLAACSLDLDAAVDCYGAFVVGTPPEGFPLKVEPIVDLAPDLSCPLLGLFGAEDQYPGPERGRRAGAGADAAAGKEFEFHTYEGAGHAFFATDRPSYRPEAANEGWQTDLGVLRPATSPGDGRHPAGRIHRAHLHDAPPTTRPEGHAMCTYQTTTLAIEGSGKGAEGWFPVTDATVYFDHPVHAPAAHTLNIDLRNPSRGAGARVAVELDPASARRTGPAPSSRRWTVHRPG